MSRSRVSIPPSETDPEARAAEQTEFEKELSASFERDAREAQDREAANAQLREANVEASNTEATDEDQATGDEPESGTTPPDSGDVETTGTEDNSEDEDKDDEDADSDTSASSTADSSTATTADSSTETSAETVRIGDRELTPEDANEAVSVLDWARSLDPETVQGIAAFISGEYVLVPAAQANQPAPATDAAKDQGAQSDSSAGDDEYLDPRVATELQELRQTVAQLSARDQQDHLVQVNQNIEQGARAFASANNLSDTEIADLQAKLARQQILPGVVAAVGGDVTTGVQRALEQIYWSDPTYRERHLQNELSTRLEKERAETEATRSKKRKAGALSGAGGSVSRVPAAPMTRQERDKAMAKEIADLMNNSGQVS